MPPLQLQILEPEVVDTMIQEALALLINPGVRVHNQEGLTLLADAGAQVDFEKQVAFIPEDLVRQALQTAPTRFFLYSLDGQPAVEYGGCQIHFDPGSAAVTILDSESRQQRPPVTEDFVKFVQLVEALPALDAQSTAFVCMDVAEEIGDLYRLYLALNYMRKPIITGAFRKDTWWTMRELLVTAAGSPEALAERPIAVFDVCPSPPLLWSDLTCQNLIDCARCRIPSELVSMPLAGATAPVTLAAAVIQHAAENLSGLTIAQLANPGAPVIWGGSPAAFDMRHGTTPMGDVGTWLIDAAYAQVGRALGLPTHAYLGMSDAKVIDAQCGFETMGGMLMAALAGINMISGAGMMDFESCQSFEKLVIDAEIIAMLKHMVHGIRVRERPMALDIIRKAGHHGDYLSQPHTVKWFRKELHQPSELVDRGSLDQWQQAGSLDTFERARLRVKNLLSTYQKPERSPEMLRELRAIATSAGQKFGMETLPALPEP